MVKHISKNSTDGPADKSLRATSQKRIIRFDFVAYIDIWVANQICNHHSRSNDIHKRFKTTALYPVLLTPNAWCVTRLSHKRGLWRKCCNAFHNKIRCKNRYYITQAFRSVYATDDYSQQTHRRSRITPQGFLANIKRTSFVQALYKKRHQKVSIATWIPSSSHVPPLDKFQEIDVDIWKILVNDLLLP